MLSQPISVRPLAASDMPALVDLIVAQEVRQHGLDARLIVRPREHVAVALAREHADSEGQSLVALDAQGRVRGYVRPGLWEIPPTNEMQTFFTARTGSIRSMTLPAPDDADAQTVVRALLAALDAFWQEQHATGAILRWPASDLWFEPAIFERGFLIDNVLAYRPPGALATTHLAPPCLRTRLAQPADEERLVALHLEEIAAHIPYTPFVHPVPALERAFRGRLAQSWNGESMEDGAPLIVVVERDQEVIAFAECELMVVVYEEDDSPGFLLPGRYGYLNNVGVHANTRGQGVGNVLVQAVFEAFAMAQVDGYMLWFSYDNPLAHRFWLHRGFQPLWRTYQRI